MADQRDAFEKFVAATCPGLRRHMLAMSGGRAADADDLVAETYARAWERWDVVGGYDRPDAWLGTVGWRLAANQWRRGRRRTDLLARWASDLSGTSCSAAERGVDVATVDRVAVAAAMRSLPAAQREVLHAYYWEGVPVAAIADRLRVPQGSVKARLSRGRVALAALLADLT